MLSLNGSNGRGWHCTFCRAIQAKIGHEKHDSDYDDNAVRAIFTDGQDWAKENNVFVPPDVDHAAAYIASRDTGGDLVIPEFMRRYCAHVTETKFDDTPPVGRTRFAGHTHVRDPRPRQVPSRVPTRVPVHARA